MMWWMACTLPEIIKKKQIICKASKLDLLEEAVTKIYTQEFYDHFHCAPISPQCLSHAAQTIAPMPQSNEPLVIDPRPLAYYDLSMFSK